MMDKQKQIEEMANVMLVNMERPKCSTSATEEQEFMNAYKFVFIGYATHLYNAGCRIMNGNAVVLTREEYEKHKGFSREEVDEISETAIKNSRKETAEKFAQALENRLDSIDTILHEDNEEEYLSKNELVELIDETCKEITERWNYENTSTI